MKMITRFLLIVVVILAGGTSVTAGVLANQTRNILLGVWQMPSSVGPGAFLSADLFTPGKTLAVKIFLERPGEEVNVTLNIEIPGKSRMTVTKTVKDNGSDDLWPEPKVVIMELITVLKYPIAQYTVEVTDQTGQKPLVKVLTNPAKPAGLGKRFGTAVADTAVALWNLPGAIADSIFSRERELTPPLRTLVITDLNGKMRKTQHVPQGELCDPIWLPNNQILVVHTVGPVSYLKVVAATLADTLQDFGGKPLNGTEPHFAPHSQTIVFRQGTKLFRANLSGTRIVPLIQNKAVGKILGVFPDAHSKTDNLIFTEDQSKWQWLAKIRGTKVLTLKRLPYDPRWALLDQARLFERQMLYEDYDSKVKVWQIYLSQTPSAEGSPIPTGLLNSRDPAWSLDGNQIVYVQGDANVPAK